MDYYESMRRSHERAGGHEEKDFRKVESRAQKGHGKVNGPGMYFIKPCLSMANRHFFLIRIPCCMDGHIGN